MDKRIRDELSVIRAVIIDALPVKQMFLFGSYAYGTPNAESDLDIYVVLSRDADIREIDAIRLIRRSIRDRKTTPVDVVVRKEDEFNQRAAAPTLERQIVQKGIVLYG